MIEEIVFTETPAIYEEPYTTVDTIAYYAQVELDSVNRLVRNHKEDLEEYGIIGFEIRKLNGRGRPRKIYQLNEQQATLLITYLDNTKPVREFKKELVHQFFEMRNELIYRRALREQEKQTRRTLTDSIQEWEYVNNWSYKHLTDLLCKNITGMNTKQLKADRQIVGSATATDLYTAEEMLAYETLENKLILLLDMNMTYEQIKAIINGETIEITIPMRKEVSQ